jgi:hypothetical protein
MKMASSVTQAGLKRIYHVRNVIALFPGKKLQSPEVDGYD